MIADNLAELYVVICQTVNGEDKGNPKQNTSDVVWHIPKGPE